MAKIRPLRESLCHYRCCVRLSSRNLTIGAAVDIDTPTEQMISTKTNERRSCGASEEYMQKDDVSISALTSRSRHIG
jgi:hypothetical protein